MPIVELSNVSKSYRMGTQSIPALQNVSLSIEQGELVAITGPSGSGKSTLLHLIGCLDSPDSGSLKICGIETASASLSQLASLRKQFIGFVFQSFNLLPKFSVLDNISLPLAYAGIPHHQRLQRARQLASSLGLQDRLHHLPSQLSGGQAQRVAIARALANSPPLLLADEPTGNLDSNTGNAVLDLLLSLNSQGQTILIVTHSPEIAARCHRCLHILDGKLQEKSPANLATQ